MSSQQARMSMDQTQSDLRRYRLLLSFSEGRESRYKETLHKLIKGLDNQLSNNDPEFCLTSLTDCLHELVPFDNFQLFVFHDMIWEQAYSSIPDSDGLSLSHGALTKRIVLNGSVAALYDPLCFSEFSAVPARCRRYYGSAVLLSCTLYDAIYLMVFSSESPVKLDLDAKKLIQSYRPFINNAIQRYHTNAGISSQIFEITSRYYNNLETVKKFIEVSNFGYWKTDADGFFDSNLEVTRDFRISRHLMNISSVMFAGNLKDLPNINDVSASVRTAGTTGSIRKIFEARGNIYKFITMVTYQGQDYYVCLHGEPQKDRNGDFEGYIGVFYDITEEIRILHSLDGAKRISEEVSRSKTQFLAMMSHEIKTPMQAIVGILDLLELTDLSQEQRDLIRHVSHSANLLQILLKDVLDYSRMGSNEMQLEELEFSIRFVMDSIIKQMEPKARENGISLVLEVSDNFPNIIVGDQNRLSQVIFNLLGNAIKFTQYGQVKLKAYVLKNRNLRFEISDTGIGISPEKVQMLFNPFRQVDASMTRRFGGTGLGLAICKKIVELMNGAIGVESALGKGSTFWFNIPERLPARDTGLINARSIVKSEPAQSEERKYRILLAEDSKVNQFIIKKMLENLGHEVRLADNGLIAVEEVQKDVPDLVLMDLQMPEMNGIEASRRIIRYNPLVVILALTANASPSERIECRDAGMIDIVSKPVTIASLRNMFQTFRGLINSRMDTIRANTGKTGFKDSSQDMIEEKAVANVEEMTEEQVEEKFEDNIEKKRRAGS
ncbi:MAG: response regulator [Succinivibrionaceae bacterium]|nr:response regulator [Succinivibrionaceae bacterium]